MNRPLLTPSFLVPLGEPVEGHRHFMPCREFADRHPEAADELAARVASAFAGLGLDLVRLDERHVGRLFAGFHDQRGLPLTVRHLATLGAWRWTQPELAGLDLMDPRRRRYVSGCFLTQIIEDIITRAGVFEDATLLVDEEGRPEPHMVLVAHPRAVSDADRNSLDLAARLADLDLVIGGGCSWADPGRRTRVWLGTPGVRFDSFDEALIREPSADAARAGGLWTGALRPAPAEIARKAPGTVR